MIDDDNAHELAKYIACDKTSEKCMYNKCTKCQGNLVPITRMNPEQQVFWYEWTNKKESRVKKVNDVEEIKQVTVSNKVKVYGTTKELETRFQRDMKDFKVHIFNIKHQNAAYK